MATNAAGGIGDKPRDPPELRALDPTPSTSTTPEATAQAASDALQAAETRPSRRTVKKPTNKIRKAPRGKRTSTKSTETRAAAKPKTSGSKQSTASAKLPSSSKKVEEGSTREKAVKQPSTSEIPRKLVATQLRRDEELPIRSDEREENRRIRELARLEKARLAGVREAEARRERHRKEKRKEREAKEKKERDSRARKAKEAQRAKSKGDRLKQFAEQRKDRKAVINAITERLAQLSPNVPAVDLREEELLESTTRSETIRIRSAASIAVAQPSAIVDLTLEEEEELLRDDPEPPTTSGEGETSQPPENAPKDVLEQLTERASELAIEGDEPVIVEDLPLEVVLEIQHDPLHFSMDTSESDEEAPTSRGGPRIVEDTILTSKVCLKKVVPAGPEESAEYEEALKDNQEPVAVTGATVSGETPADSAPEPAVAETRGSEPQAEADSGRTGEAPKVPIDGVTTPKEGGGMADSKASEPSPAVDEPMDTLLRVDSGEAQEELALLVGAESETPSESVTQADEPMTASAPAEEAASSTTAETPDKESCSRRKDVEAIVESLLPDGLKYAQKVLKVPPHKREEQINVLPVDTEPISTPSSAWDAPRVIRPPDWSPDQVELGMGVSRWARRRRNKQRANPNPRRQLTVDDYVSAHLSPPSSRNRSKKS